MSRLTIKNSDGSHNQAKDTSSYNMFFKLSALEDVLEEFGIESAEELRERFEKQLDHDKQVRKEVVEEIKEKLNKYAYQMCCLEHPTTLKYGVFVQDIISVLDRIEKE